jgi:hypothetical protein
LFLHDLAIPARRLSLVEAAACVFTGIIVDWPMANRMLDLEAGAHELVAAPVDYEAEHRRELRRRQVPERPHVAGTGRWA